MNFLSKGDGQQVNHHDYSSDSQAKTIDNAPDSHDVQRMVNQRHLSLHSSKSRSHEPQNDLNSPIATTLEPFTINLNTNLQHSRAQNPNTHDSKADSKVSPVDQASMPFKLLSNKGEKKLKGKDPTAWKSYRQALIQRFPEKAKNKPGIKVKKRERKIQKLMNTTTAEVDEVLSRVGRWPLPPEKSSITNKILMGETFYAREPKWSQNSQIHFRYPPFLNDKGMPFKASEFSYREFIPIFLVENHDRIEKITELDVAEAFRASIKVVFPHVYWAHQDMLSTCTMAAEHSFLDEAKAQVKMALALKNNTTSSSTSMENINARVRIALSSFSMENNKNQTNFSSAMEKSASLSSTSTEDENQQILRESIQKVPTEKRIKGASLASSQVFDHSELPGMDKEAEIPKIETLDQDDPASMDIEAELSEKETLTRRDTAGLIVLLSRAHSVGVIIHAIAAQGPGGVIDVGN
ncbi:hypothetical protein K3495_g1427 [Podosphaera aphanis]|nr:hypothetical protein K3495_g1427 [Podosphaera aphanis]